MRQFQFAAAFAAFSLLAPDLRFWKRGSADLEREVAIRDIYAILSANYDAVANLSPEWTEAWTHRHAAPLPPRFSSDESLPAMTIDAVREMRFARSLLQRHRWRSVQQPLFENIEPTAWASLQRRLQMVSPELLAAQDAHIESLRQDEIDWISSAVEGYDKARLYIRTAIRDDEPVERQVANTAYVTLHLSLQLSDRLIERQRFELSDQD